MLVLLMAVGFGLLAGAKAWNDARLGERLTPLVRGSLSDDEKAARTAQALLLSQSSLDRITSPNLYGVLSGEAVSRLFLAKATEVLAGLKPPEGFEHFGVRPVSMTLGDAVVTVKLDVDGSLESRNVGFESSVTVVAAPTFDGASMTLIPLAVDATVRRVKVWTITDEGFLPGLASGAIRPAIGAVIMTMPRIAIPIELGVTEDLDLSAALSRQKDLSVKTPRIPVRVAFRELAMVASPEGLELVGDARAVTNSEYEAAKVFLRNLETMVKDPPPCEDCAMQGLDLDAYFVCIRRSMQCRANRALGSGGGADRGLAPVELLALQDLGESKDPADRTAHARLSSLLAPRVSGEDASGWNRVTTAHLIRTVRQRMKQLRAVVDAGNEFPGLRSGMLVRRDFLGQLVNNSLHDVLLTTELSLPEQAEQQLDPDENIIKSNPAPDLKCTENAGGCDSHFEYDGHRPRGCDSDCTHDKCVDLGLLGKHCTKAVDLGCVGRKIDCERLKEQERLAYEVRKAAAHTEFLAKKAACEAVREMKITGCEINQGWLEKTGNMELGKITGSYRVKSATVNAMDLSASVGDDLSTFSIRGRVGGSADVGADIVYTPIGAGHIACVAQWGGPLHAQVQIDPTEINIVGTLDESGATMARNQLVYRIAEQKVTYRLVPPPGLALVTQTPQVALACPVPAALFTALPGVAGPVGHLVQFKLLTRDNFETTIPARTITIPLTAGPIGGPEGVQIAVGREVVVLQMQ